MDPGQTSRRLSLPLSAVFVAVTLIAKTTATQSPPNANSGVKTADGLTVVTFTLDPGKISVNLPDDMRAGDTISGTVVAEPKGQSEAERTKNMGELTGLVIDFSTPKKPDGT